MAKFKLPDDPKPLEKKFRLVELAIGNAGPTDAENPDLMLSIENLPQFIDKSKKWLSFLHLNRSFADTEFVVLPTQTQAPSEKELAYILATRGFSEIDSIEHASSEKFVLGIVFETGKFWYIPSTRGMISIPFGLRMPITLAARARNASSLPVVEDPFFVVVDSFDNINVVYPTAVKVSWS